MMRFFRWGYIVPRLAILITLVCVSEFASGWLVKSAIRSAGEPALGARIDIARSKASLLHSHVSLRGLQIANPDEPMTNRVEADAVELDLDGAALLRKRGVVTHGVIRGLQFGTSRAKSGELPDADDPSTESAGKAPWEISGLADAAGDRAKQWLDNLGDRFTGDMQEQFESPKLARSLRDKWPAKYAELAATAEAIRNDAQQLKEQVSEARKNPLRNAAYLKSVPTRVSVLESKLRQLYTDVEALPGLVEADRQAVAAARLHDEQLVRETLAVDNLDAASLSAYLLGEELAGPMNQLVGWLRWARQMAPARVNQMAAPERSRGVDVLFAGVRPRPDLLIETLELSGATRLGGRPVALSGQLTNVTSHPAIHGEPVRLTLNTTGAIPLRVQATIDRTGPIARDELLADCEGLIIPATKLGGDKWLGLSVAASPASLNISIQLDGDQLTGDVQLVQHTVDVTPLGDLQQASGINAAAVAPLRDALASNLKKLPTIATRVDLAGTLDEPEFNLWSNLGPAVAQAMESALQNTIDTQTDRLLAASRAEVDEQLAKLDGELAAAQAKLQPALAGPADAIKQVAAELTGGNPFRQLGRMPGIDGLLK
ncbi:MAG: TIGR03545 family protein [Planctomycetota bacterium]